jgi:hypothetical protein
MERRGTEVSTLATGGRQRLQRSEGARARSVQNRHVRGNIICKAPRSGLPALRFAAAPAVRQLRYVAGVHVAGASW